MAASNGNVHEKSWKKALPYLELALPGVRLELSISQLQQAHKHQKANRKMKCIMCLAPTLILLLLVLIVVKS